MQKLNQEIVGLIDNLLGIGISMAAEQDYYSLLRKILTGARRVTRADAGTIYLLKEGCLHFEFMQNDTLDIDREARAGKIDLPPVPLEKDKVAGYCALTQEVIKIDDVYKNDRFDFSGPREYDSITGYQTRSMMVAPMKDHREDVIGVIQLINAQDDEGNLTAFPSYQKKVIASLASQAAVALNNARVMQKKENLFKGIIEGVASAADGCTPYDNDHTRRVARMTDSFIDAVNQNSLGELGSKNFSPGERQELMLSAWLHDIGKIAVPGHLWKKSDRLGEKYSAVRQRFDLLEKMLEDRLEHQDYEREAAEKKLKFLRWARSVVKEANAPDTIVTEEMQEDLEKIYSQPILQQGGDKRDVSLLQKSELQALCTREGPLTGGEEEKLEAHINVIQQILQHISFPDRLQAVPKLVGAHHEYLDGSGYPEGLQGEEIPLGARLLTIVNEFDSLVGAVPPYRKARSVDQALKKLREKREAGKLDGELLEIFSRFKVWEGIDFTGTSDYKFT